VPVLKPVETVTAWTGHRIMMSGIAPPFRKRPVRGRGFADQWEF
jgi:hypothetical protein